MVDVVWQILLTVCLQGDCVSQEVMTFNNQKTCETVKQQYIELPKDGHWTSVTYICKPRGSVSL